MQELLLYGPIGDWWEGTTAAQIAETLGRLDFGDYRLRINSEGGFADDGIAIYNLMRDRPPVETIIDGIAASAASVVAMASPVIEMRRGSRMMIHEGLGLVIGGASDMRSVATALDKLNSEVAEIYAARAAGLTRTAAQQAMAVETWYTPAEAVEAGLADKMDSSAMAELRTATPKLCEHMGYDHIPCRIDGEVVIVQRSSGHSGEAEGRDIRRKWTQTLLRQQLEVESQRLELHRRRLESIMS